MLTVNHKDINGDGSVYEVTKVKYLAECGGDCDSSHKPITGWVILYFDSKKETHEAGCLCPANCVSLKSGTVYVMNSTGKTIVTYDLGGQEIPDAARLFDSQVDGLAETENSTHGPQPTRSLGVNKHETRIDDA